MIKQRFFGTSRTNKHLEHNTHDITVIEKLNDQVWIIDIVIPGVNRIEKKEMGKAMNCQNLQIKPEHLWEKKATIVPSVIGA